MSINRSSNNPSTSTTSLYDQFLQILPPEDETSSPFIKALSNLGVGGTTASPGSSTHSNSNRSHTDGVSEEESLNAARRNEFLDKIYEPVDPSKVHGFDYDKKSLKMLLLNLNLNERNQDSFKLLGVVGMVGVGKTTLCRSVFEEEEVKQRFVPRIQITMTEWKEPRSRSMERVVEKMLEHLGVEENFIDFISSNHKLPGLLYALYLQLKGKRYLILLDDVRDKDGYYETLISCLRDGHGFPKSHGAAIIVTSRHEAAIKTMVGEQNLHRLLPLSDPESFWPIYENASMAPDSYTPSNTPKEVKEELKKKCGGLPLAARILGELKRQETSASAIETEKNGSTSKEASDISKDGSSQASVAEDQAPTVSGNGSKEASSVSGDGLNEAAVSKDGQNYQAPAASDDHGFNESTASKDGPNEESMVSGNGSNGTPTASKDGSSQASTASSSNKADLQPATNNQSQT